MRSSLQRAQEPSFWTPNPDNSRSYGGPRSSTRGGSEALHGEQLPGSEAHCRSQPVSSTLALRRRLLLCSAHPCCSPNPQCTKSVNAPPSAIFFRCRLVVRAVEAPAAADLAELQRSPAGGWRHASARLTADCAFVDRRAACTLAACAAACDDWVWPPMPLPLPATLPQLGFRACLPWPPSAAVRKALLARGWDLAWIDGVTGEILKRKLTASVSEIEAAVRLLLCPEQVQY